MKNKETLAKIFVCIMVLLALVLVVVLVVCVKNTDFNKVKEEAVEKVTEVVDNSFDTEKPDVEDVEPESDIDEPTDIEGDDVPGAPDRIEAEEGTLIPNEKYYLYDMSEYGDDLVMYSNRPNYNWVTDDDWAAFLYVDYAAEMDVANYDEEAINVTTDSVNILDHAVTVYIYEVEDCITVVSAVYDDVVLEVQNYAAKDVETAVQNFVKAADIQLVKE